MNFRSASPGSCGPVSTARTGEQQRVTGRISATVEGPLDPRTQCGPSAPGVPIGCQWFIMDVPTYSETIFITDAAINIFPDLDAKRDIVQNAIDLFTEIGLGAPRVAILSAVETVTPKIPSTIDAAALCKMADRGQISGGILDGPLAFDNAIDPEAAKIKGIKSEVAGRAQILVVPDLEAGNMLAKNLTFLAKADAAGIVLGARVPIVLTSRANSVRSRLASCAVAVLYAHARRGRVAVPAA